MTRDTWHVTRDTCHVTRDTWQVTRDTWHVTRDTFGGVNILSKFQLPSSYRLWFMILWRSGGKGWIAEWINELITRLFVGQPRLHRVCQQVRWMGRKLRLWITSQKLGLTHFFRRGRRSGRSWSRSRSKADIIVNKQCFPELSQCTLWVKNALVFQFRFICQPSLGCFRGLTAPADSVAALSGGRKSFPSYFFMIHPHHVYHWVKVSELRSSTALQLPSIW